MRDELFTANVRYKLPGENESNLLDFPVTADSVKDTGEATIDFYFAASVAGFGMILRDSPYRGTVSFSSVISMAQESLGADEYGLRYNFVEMVRKAEKIK